MRYEAGGKPKAKPPRPHHVRALKLADAKLKRERNAAKGQFDARGVRIGGPQAQPASRKAKPLSHDEQLQIAVDAALKRSGLKHQIQTSGIGAKLRPPSILTRAGTQFGTDLLYAGPGAVIAAKNVGQDVKAALPKTKGGATFPRTRKIGVELGKHVYQDVRHPRKNVGHLGFDVAAALAGGGGSVARVTATGKALRAGEGVGRAVTRRGSEGGSLLHAPEPGTAKLTAGGATVEKPLSRNAAYRQIQKARYARKQARLNQRRAKIQPEPQGTPGRVTEALTAPEQTFGRRLRVERRLEQAQAKGDLNYVHRLGKKLNREEHTALRVAAIEGDKALRDPVGVIDRQIATHQKHIASGEDKAAHLSIIRDLESAKRVLAKPSERFKNALEATRQLSTKGEQEAIAKGFLKQGTADSRRLAIAKEYGHAGDAPPQGSFYFHAGAGKKRPGQLGRVYEPRPAQTGMGPVQIGRYAPELKHQFLGKGITKGTVPLDIPKAVTQSYQRRLVAHSAHDLYGTLHQASTPTRMSRYDIPLRDSTKISTELKKYFQTVEDNIHASPDAIQAMTKQQVDRLKHELEAAEHVDAPLGANIKGVRWVDSRMIKDLGQTNLRGWFEKTADAVTNPIRFGTLYLRPAYALNLLGNAGMLAPEGASAISAVGRAVRMPKRIGERNTDWVDAQMGTGKALGQQVNTGFMARATHGLAEAWNKGTDLHARRAAFEIEARRAGVRTQADFDRLRSDPALAPKRRQITERARSIIGDYENLTPVEKNQVRRALYFYPWTKVATKWLGHTLTEHPIKTAVAAHLGQDEAQHVKKVMGQVPAWVDQAGLIPVGKSKGGLVDTINPASVNTPATPIQTAQAGLNAARGIAGLPQAPGAGLKDLLTPAFESFTSAANPAQPGQRTGIVGALESTPIPAALRRAGVYGKASKTYPEQGVGPAVRPLFAGGLAPRATSLDALHKQAEKEMKLNMSPEQKTAYDFKKWRDTADKVLAHHGVKMPKEYAARLDLWHERTVARRKAGRTWDAHIAADLDVIFSHGWIDEQQLAAAKANIARIPKNKHAALSKQLTETYFDRDGMLHQGAKEMGLPLPR